MPQIKNNNKGSPGPGELSKSIISSELSKSIISSWNCNENGGDRLDLKRNWNFTEIGSVASEFPGKHNGSCSPGTDTANRLTGTTGGPFGFGDNSFSIHAWMRVESGAVALNHPIVAKWDAFAAPDVDDCWILWFRTANDQFRFSISSDGTSEETIVETTDFVASNNYQRVAAGYNADTNEIWIIRENGTRVIVAHTGGAFSGSVAPITLGWFRGSGASLMGSEPFDEVIIFNKYLDDTLLDQLWNNGDGSFFEDFGDGDGNVIHNDHGRSGNNHGTGGNR